MFSTNSSRKHAREADYTHTARAAFTFLMGLGPMMYLGPSHICFFSRLLSLRADESCESTDDLRNFQVNDGENKTAVLIIAPVVRHCLGGQVAFVLLLNCSLVY